MPELPEVETVCNELRKVLLGKKFVRIEALRGNIRLPIPDLAVLEGLKIKNIERRAKYIIVNFGKTDDSLVIHLGMSGKILIGPKAVRKKHDHVIFEMSDGREMVFNDARRFGVVTLKSEAGKLFEHLGVEPFSEEFDGDYLYRKLRARKSPVKPILMDQQLVVGVGNIYASEALFRSKISPKRAADKITKAQANGLVKNIRIVLQESIDSGGSTLRDYVRSTGDTGHFQHRFLVYGKTGKPCIDCGTKIKKIVQAGRSTFFCPNCQK